MKATNAERMQVGRIVERVLSRDQQLSNLLWAQKMDTIFASAYGQAPSCKVEESIEKRIGEVIQAVAIKLKLSMRDTYQFWEEWSHSCFPR